MPERVNVRQFLYTFKTRLIDCYMQQWKMDINNNGKLTLYKELKNSFCYEKYLDILSIKQRREITKIRISAHSLCIETGRSMNIVRNERFCKYCLSNNSRLVEDEYHFLIECPLYRDLREKFLPKYYWKRPSVYKVVELVSNERRKCIIKLGSFITNSIFRRNHHVAYTPI